MFIPDEKPIILFRIIQLGVKTADFKILNFFLAETQKYHLQSWLDIHKTSYDQSWNFGNAHLGEVGHWKLSNHRNLNNVEMKHKSTIKTRIVLAYGATILLQQLAELTRQAG